MLTFREGSDPHSLDVVRDGKVIGFLDCSADVVWTPRVVLRVSVLSVEELREIVAKYEEVKS